MTRHINAETLAHLRRWEGCVLYAYDDKDGSNPRRFIKPGDSVSGTLTIGYGHTETVVPGMRITQEEADRLFKADLVPRITAVEQMVRVPLTDNQFGVLLSWAFNVGLGAARKSTLIRKLNDGDYDVVPGELAKWNKQGGKVVPGLVNRRAAEAGLWAKGEFVASASVDVAPPPTAPSPANDTGIMAGVAGAAATAAPFISGLSGVHWAVGVAVVVGAVAIAALWLLKRQRAA